MIIPAGNRLESVREKPQNGEGRIMGLHSLTADNRPEDTRFKMAAQMTLPPGSAIGFHRHEADEEMYYITAGRGLYTKNDGQVQPVFPGDMTLTRRGQGHGLANDGDEPLTFLAVIVA